MARRNQGPRLKWHRSGCGFYICWNQNGIYRERSTGTKDSNEAQAVFAEWLQARRKPDGPSDPAKTLVTDLLTEYATQHGANVMAPRAIGSALDPLASFWECKTAGDVCMKSCESYTKWRQKSVSTARRELSVLRAALNWAFKNGRITRVPPVTLPPAPPPRQRWLTRQEAARLLRAAMGEEKVRLYLPLFILIGLYTGRRKEAILSLRWPQVDLERRVINFDLPGRRLTDKVRGKVGIPDRLLPHLIRARRRGTEMGYVLHINGRPIGDIKKGLTAACKRAGLNDVTAHTLRHTAATWLMHAKVSMWDAARFLGMSPATLDRVYAHHHPDFMQDALAAVGSKAFRGIPR
jgi:integrase